MELLTDYFQKGSWKMSYPILGSSMAKKESIVTLFSSKT